MTRPVRRGLGLARVAAGLGVGLGGALLASACGGAPKSSPVPPPVTATRSATPQACVAWPRPQTMRGLPLVDARTQPVDPHVLGEMLTWRGADSTITAFIGIDAIDVLEDLDFVPLPARRAGVRQWTTAPYPTLFLAETVSGFAAPCDRLYVSTTGLPATVATSVVTRLRVRRGPAATVFPTSVP